ncbi:hypothetical protein, partial [Acidiphilium sp. 37-64-53]|uniref:hypothetical protein n=1 Tax=Acidiphilium sp. 37-64-53 TaxID=1970299 RepID=UPI00257D881A
MRRILLLPRNDDLRNAVHLRQALRHHRVIPTCLSNDRFDPVSLCDRSDLFWHLHELVPGVS